MHTGGVGDPELEAEARLRRGRRWFGVLALLLVTALIAGGAWINAQAPAAVALQTTPAAVPVPAQALDSRAAIVTDRLSAASGRSLGSLAEAVAEPESTSLESEAPTVAGARAATEKYSETLAQLSEAEAAAAEDLALTEEEVAAAEEARKQAAEDLAEEEAAAARQVDAAIDAAISAAQAKSSYQGYLGSLSGGGIPTGESTNTAKVLKLVRKHFPADQVGNAMAVARCESGHGNRVSKPNGNGTRDFGVFQINDGGTLQAALRKIGVSFSGIDGAREKAMNPAINVRLARAIWDSRGWQPWTCAAKLQIVAGLYQRAPGPMDGNYDDYGRVL
jgi:hypothetical protein